MNYAAGYCHQYAQQKASKLRNFPNDLAPKWAFDLFYWNYRAEIGNFIPLLDLIPLPSAADVGQSRNAFVTNCFQTINFRTQNCTPPNTHKLTQRQANEPVNFQQLSANAPIMESLTLHGHLSGIGPLHMLKPIHVCVRVCVAKPCELIL